LKSFLESGRIVLQRQLELSHRVVAVAADEVGGRAVGEVDFFREVLHGLVVLVYPFEAHASVMEVLQIFGVGLQGHRVVLDGFVEEPDAHVAVRPVGVALAVCTVELYLF
jgi:hypothetical protein